MTNSENSEMTPEEQTIERLTDEVLHLEAEVNRVKVKFNALLAAAKQEREARKRFQSENILLRRRNQKLQDEIIVDRLMRGYSQQFGNLNTEDIFGNPKPKDEIPDAMLKKILSLVHPDKNDNSDLSVEVTQFINNMRDKK